MNDRWDILRRQADLWRPNQLLPKIFLGKFLALFDGDFAAPRWDLAGLHFRAAGGCCFFPCFLLLNLPRRQTSERWQDLPAFGLTRTERGVILAGRDYLVGSNAYLRPVTCRYNG